MNPNPDPLEKTIHDALRALPNRRAPRSLEARVMAEIARRDALPWWRRSIAYWPAPVRWSFFALSAALCGLAIAASLTFMGGGFRALAPLLARGPWERLTTLASGLHSVLVASRDVLNLIPQPWLYGAIGGLVLLYAVLVGLGASLYRFVVRAR